MGVREDEKKPATSSDPFSAAGAPKCDFLWVRKQILVHCRGGGGGGGGAGGALARRPLVAKDDSTAATTALLQTPCALGFLDEFQKACGRHREKGEEPKGE